MTNIGSMCGDWNAARYKQELDVELATKLLDEELLELFEAITLVDKLDACGDIAFVAIGILWKAGIPQHELDYIVNSVPLTRPNKLQSMKEAASRVVLVGIQPKDEVVVTYALLMLYIIVPTYLASIGYLSEYYSIIEAVCISNNTKEVTGITASNIKANIVKGSNYVSPTNDLIKIIERNSNERV